MRTQLLNATVFCLFLLPMTGCGTDSTQRMALLEAAIRAGQEEVARDKQVIAELQDQWLAARTEWADPNRSPEVLQELAAKMQTIEAKVIAATAAVQAKEADIEAYRKELAEKVARGNITPGEEMQLVGKGTSEVGRAVGGPWGAIIAAAGMIITGIGTALVKNRQAKAEVEATEARAESRATREDRNSQQRLDQAYEKVSKFEQQREEAETAIAGIVASVSELLAAKDIVADPEKAKSVLARAQVKTPEAAAAVRKVLDAAKTDGA